jgi:imidazolonepropionase
LVHDHNPLTDFKLLYGTGAMRLNDATRQTEWHRALRYTIKDGVIYDTGKLLADVRELVAKSFAEEPAARS